MGCFKRVAYCHIGTIIIGAILLTIVMLTLCVNKKIDQNQYGVFINKYTMDVSGPFDQGTYTIKPGDSMNFYTSTVQYYDDDIYCMSKDGLQIALEISYQYLYQRNSLIPIMLYDFSDEGNYLSGFNAIVESAIYKSCAFFNSEDYYTQRQKIEANMSITVTNAIGNSGIGIDLNIFQIKNIQFPYSFNDAITQKQILIQQVQTQLNKRVSQLISVNTTLIQAQQIAKQIKIQTDNNVNIIIAQANATSNIINTQWLKRASTYKTIMDKQNINSTQLVSYIEYELIRLSSEPTIQL